MRPAMDPAAAWLLAFAMIIFMKIVCFVLGYLTVRLGYKLLLAGVRGEFKFSARLGGGSADLASISPGVFFVLLGIGLAVVALQVDKTVTVSGSRPRMSMDALDHSLDGVVDTLTFSNGGTKHGQP